MMAFVNSAGKLVFQYYENEIDISSRTASLSELVFTVSGVEAGRFELVSAPGVAIKSFTQAQLTSGGVRFVPTVARFGGASVAGSMAAPPRYNEISGLVASIRNPDILWAHEDSDNPAALIAFGTDANIRGEWTPSGITNSDWEDIGIATVGGEALLYVGDFGDNSASRSDLKIYRIKEPVIADDTGGVIPADDIETISFQYPPTPAGERGGADAGLDGGDCFELHQGD